MKKKAFTVAEVFIALLTVGVLAAMVLPTLYHNIQRTMFRNARKAQRERISQGITMMSLRVNRFNYNNSYDFLTDLQRYMKVPKVCSSDRIGDCWPYEELNLGNGDKYRISRARSSSVFASDTDSTGAAKKAVLDRDPDGNVADYTRDNAVFVTESGVPVLFTFNKRCTPNSANLNRNCYVALLDVNGSGGPNELGWDILLINSRHFAGVVFADRCENKRRFLVSNTEVSGGAGARSCVIFPDDD